MEKIKLLTPYEVIKETESVTDSKASDDRCGYHLLNYKSELLVKTLVVIVSFVATIHLLYEQKISTQEEDNIGVSVDIKSISIPHDSFLETNTKERN